MDSTLQVKNFIQKLVLPNGKLRALGNNEKLPRGCRFVSGNNNSGIIHWSDGIDYAYAVVNGKVRVMTDKQAGNNWSETIYSDKFVDENFDREVMHRDNSSYIRELKIIKESLDRLNRKIEMLESFEDDEWEDYSDEPDDYGEQLYEEEKDIELNSEHEIDAFIAYLNKEPHNGTRNYTIHGYGMLLDLDVYYSGKIRLEWVPRNILISEKDSKTDDLKYLILNGKQQAIKHIRMLWDMCKELNPDGNKTAWSQSDIQKLASVSYGYFWDDYKEDYVYPNPVPLRNRLLHFAKSLGFTLTEQ